MSNSDQDAAKEWGAAVESRIRDLDEVFNLRVKAAKAFRQERKIALQADAAELERQSKAAFWWSREAATGRFPTLVGHNRVENAQERYKILDPTVTAHEQMRSLWKTLKLAGVALGAAVGALIAGDSARDQYENFQTGTGTAGVVRDQIDNVGERLAELPESQVNAIIIGTGAALGGAAAGASVSAGMARRRREEARQEVLAAGTGKLRVSLKSEPDSLVPSDYPVVTVTNVSGAPITDVQVIVAVPRKGRSHGFDYWRYASRRDGGNETAVNLQPEGTAVLDLPWHASRPHDEMLADQPSAFGPSVVATSHKDHLGRRVEQTFDGGGLRQPQTRVGGQVARGDLSL